MDESEQSLRRAGRTVRGKRAKFSPTPFTVEMLAMSAGKSVSRRII